MNTWEYLLRGYKIIVEKAIITLSVKDSNKPEEPRLAILQAKIWFHVEELKDGRRNYLMYVEIPESILIETHELPSSSARFLCDEIDKWIKENGTDLVRVEEDLFITIENERYEPVHIGYDSFISTTVASGYNKPYVRYLT